MDTSLIMRIAGLGLLVAILNIVLIQAKRDELAYALGLAGIILALLWLFPWVSQLLERVESTFRLW
ncbi:MAG: stage III sporulation protein AC [Limnochordia bacterium]|jgi:stage III sporulation protein AC|nr:stage III sporulation protein AC [Bacillota bacterium]